MAGVDLSDTGESSLAAGTRGLPEGRNAGNSRTVHSVGASVGELRIGLRDAGMELGETVDF